MVRKPDRPRTTFRYYHKEDNNIFKKGSDLHSLFCLAAVGQCFPICEANGDFSRRGKLAAERSEAASPSAEEPTAAEGDASLKIARLRLDLFTKV